MGLEQLRFVFATRILLFFPRLCWRGELKKAANRFIDMNRTPALLYIKFSLKKVDLHKQSSPFFFFLTFFFYMVKVIFFMTISIELSDTA